MAAFPTGLRLEWRDMAEAPESVVAREPMERGIPKQRRVASDARVELPLVLHFDSKAAVLRETSVNARCSNQLFQKITNQAAMDMHSNISATAV